MDVFTEGSRVVFDGNPGTVREQHDSDRGPESFDYTVDWDNGHASRVWGSDLLPEGLAAI